MKDVVIIISVALNIAQIYLLLVAQPEAQSKTLAKVDAQATQLVVQAAKIPTPIIHYCYEGTLYKPCL